MAWQRLVAESDSVSPSSSRSLELTDDEASTLDDPEAPRDPRVKPRLGKTGERDAPCGASRSVGSSETWTRARVGLVGPRQRTRRHAREGDDQDIRDRARVDDLIHLAGSLDERLPRGIAPGLAPVVDRSVQRERALVDDDDRSPGCECHPDEPPGVTVICAMATSVPALSGSVPPEVLEPRASGTSASPDGGVATPGVSVIAVITPASPTLTSAHPIMRLMPSSFPDLSIRFRRSRGCRNVCALRGGCSASPRRKLRMRLDPSLT